MAVHPVLAHPLFGRYAAEQVAGTCGLADVADVRYAGQMHIREWDPATAPDRDLQAWLQVSNDALAVDLPGDPPWGPVSLREYLTGAMPDEQRGAWFAEDADGVHGHASLILLGNDAADESVVEVVVEPGHRGQGIGRALLTAAVARARTVRRVITSEAVEGTSMTAFYERLGFTRVAVEERSVLALADVDWPAIDAAAEHVGAGYRLIYCPGGPGEDLLYAYAAAKAAVGLAPQTADVEWRHGSTDADRLRTSIATLKSRGIFPHVVVAQHEATGTVVGLTELAILAQRPQRADQYDTLVLPRHRGYGLGLAMKARMLHELRTAEPDLIDVQTWANVEAEAMQRVNAELGFHQDRRWLEYETDIPTLAAHLGLG